MNANSFNASARRTVATVSRRASLSAHSTAALGDCLPWPSRGRVPYEGQQALCDAGRQLLHYR